MNHPHAISHIMTRLDLRIGGNLMAESLNALLLIKTGFAKQLTAWC